MKKFCEWFGHTWADFDIWNCRSCHELHLLATCSRCGERKYLDFKRTGEVAPHGAQEEKE